MDIHEFHDQFRIGYKKIRLMDKAGVLRIEKDKTPEWWLRTISDIKKGKMSARSIALAFRDPEKLAKMSSLTRFDRRVIEENFKAVDLPAIDIGLPVMTAPVLGAADKNVYLMGKFIEAIQMLIPDYGVSYYYLAVRLMLTCENEHQIFYMSENMTKAFSNAKDDPTMRGWWYSAAAPHGKNQTIYHQPRRYDL